MPTERFSVAFPVKYNLFWIKIENNKSKNGKQKIKAWLYQRKEVQGKEKVGFKLA